MNDPSAKQEPPKEQAKLTGRRYDSVAALREDTEGHFCEKRCPKCNSTLLRNKLGDEWCSFIECDFGLTPASTPADAPTVATGEAGDSSQIVKQPEVMFAVYARGPGSENWFEQETNTDEALVREWRDRNNERSPQLYDPPREYILVRKETTFTKLP